MKKRLFTITGILLFMCVTTSSATEKVGTTSMQFLKLSLDARSAAMGNAAVSTVHTSEALFWNPAAMRLSSTLDISTSYINYFLDVKLFTAAVSYPIGRSAAIGAFAIIADYGTLEETRADENFLNFWATIKHNGDWTYNPGLTGNTFNPSADVFGISYALSVTDKLTFGLSAKYMMEDLYIAKASSYSFDGGLIYETGWRSLMFGLAIRNFGPEVTFMTDSYPVPETFDAGISGYLVAPGNSLLGSLGSQTLLFAFDLTHPRDYDQQYNLGAEYGLMDILFLRGGYKLNFDEEGLTCGVGLHYHNFRLDYAYDKFGDILPSVHRFSIGYALN